MAGVAHALLLQYKGLVFCTVCDINIELGRLPAARSGSCDDVIIRSVLLVGSRDLD